MSLTDKLNAAYQDLQEAQQIAQVRALIQPIRDDTVRVNAEIQAIADTGVLNQADPEIKAALQSAWNVIKNGQTAFEDATITELLDWRPQ